MNVGELIEELKKYPPEAIPMAWSGADQQYEEVWETELSLDTEVTKEGKLSKIDTVIFHT